MSFKEPKATTTEPGSITLAGDLAGTATSPTVAKINTHTVATQTLGAAQDGYVLTWVNANSDWEAKATTGGSGSGGLTAPVTSTVRTNTSNATYTVDTTGGGNDYTILNSNALTALAVTFSLTNNSQTITSSASTTINGGTCIVFGGDTVAYVVATTGTSTTTFTISTAYQGATASGVIAETFNYYNGAYKLPVASAGRALQIKDTTGYAETNPITILPNGIETINGIPAVLSVNTPINLVNGTNFVMANPMLQPIPTVTYTLTNSTSVTASATQATTLFAGSQIVFSLQPNVVYTVATVGGTAVTLTQTYGGTIGTTIAGKSLASITFTTNGTASVTVAFNNTAFSVANILFPGSSLIFWTGGGTPMIENGNGGSGTNATYIISSISTSTITLTQTASFTASHIMASTVNMQSLNGTFATTSGSTIVTASQSQNGYIIPGSQIYFANSGTLDNSPITTVTWLSPDGKTILLNSSTGIATRAAATAIADLTGLAIGGLGMPYGGSNLSMLFGSDTTYYPVINISPSQTNLSNAGVKTPNGNTTASVIQNSTAVTISNTQANVIGNNVGFANTSIIFGNQPYATYTIASFNNSTGITLTTPFTGSTNANTSAIIIGPNSYVSISNGSTTCTFASAVFNVMDGTPILFASQPGIIYIVSSITQTGTAATLLSNFTGPGSSQNNGCILLSTTPVLQLSTNYTGTTATVTSYKMNTTSIAINKGVLNLVSNDGTNWITI